MSVFKVNNELLKGNKYISNMDDYEEFETSCLDVYSEINKRDANYNTIDELRYLTEKLEEFEYDVEPFENELEGIRCYAKIYIGWIRQEYNNRINDAKLELKPLKPKK